MDKPLADWLIPWLARPGWQLLAVQWLVLTGLGLLVGSGWVNDTWQQRERLYQQRQQLEQQIAERQQQLGQLPSLAELEQRLRRQALIVPEQPQDFGGHLYQLGGRLLRFQQQENVAQQRVRLQLDYTGLLRLLDGLSPTRRIGQMKIEMQSEGLITQLTLVGAGEGTDE